MFVENYRLDTMIGGQAQTAIPYPKISDEDWQKWKAFLPVKSAPFCKKVLLNKKQRFLEANYFEEIEVWGKREISKDPIAVGITENGSRHLICRWGMDRLIPFERIKSRSWIYQIQNLGVTLVTSESFWLRFAVASLLAMGYITAFLNA